jgi:hypothetical protein
MFYVFEDKVSCNLRRNLHLYPLRLSYKDITWKWYTGSGYFLVVASISVISERRNMDDTSFTSD